MDPSRSRRLVHVINNCEGPGQYNTNCNIFLFLCIDLSFIKLLINAIEKIGYNIYILSLSEFNLQCIHYYIQIINESHINNIYTPY